MTVAGIKAIPLLHMRTLLILVVLGIVFELNVFGQTDPDFWWHVKTGELIVQTGNPASIDNFSYTSDGASRVPQDWASEILFFLIFRVFGYAGDLILVASIVTLTFFLVFWLSLRLGINEMVALLLVFWGVVLARPFFTVRPLIFTWLFFAIFLTSLYLYHRGIIRWLWHLPLLMVLWVNLHGGFAIGLGLIGLLIIAEAADALLAKKIPNVRHPLVVLGLSSLASLVNPDGLTGLSYPLRYLGFGNGPNRFIIEWQSPSFHESYWLSLLASLLLLMALGVTNRKLGSWPLLLTMLLAAMALQSERHIPLYGLALAPVVGEILKARFDTTRWFKHKQVGTVSGRMNWLILAGFTGGCLSLAVASPLSQLKELPLQSRPLPYPVAGANYVLTHYPEARVFNDYSWGGYLIYTFYPRQKVFIDGRTDLYSEKLLNDYDDVINLRPNWRDILDNYGVDLVLIRKGSPLSVLLDASPLWQKVFSGEVEDIFVRNIPTNPPI